MLIVVFILCITLLISAVSLNAQGEIPTPMQDEYHYILLPLILQNDGDSPSKPLVFDPPEISELLHGENGLRVSWSGCNEATSFRLLYGQGGARPDEIHTTAKTVVLPSIRETGKYQFTVECYDERGNSVFGQPSFVEINQVEVNE